MSKKTWSQSETEMSNDLHVFALKIDRNCQCYILEGLQTNVAFFIYGAILHQMIILRDLFTQIAYNICES